MLQPAVDNFLKIPSVRVRAASIATLIMLAAVGPLWAQTERSGGGGANVQLYQQYQQATTEKAQLQTDNSKLKADLADVQKQLSSIKKQLADAQAAAATSKNSVDAAQSARDQSNKNYETLKAQTEDLIAHFRETATNLQSVETDRTQLRQELSQSKTALDKCATDNYELYKVDDEVLDRYSHQGTFSHLTRAEPFTRLERTRIDNTVLEYRARAEALRVNPPNGNGSAPSPAASESSLRTPPSAAAQGK